MPVHGRLLRHRIGNCIPLVVERDLGVLHGIPLIQLERQHWNLVLSAVERVQVRQHQDQQVLHGVPVIQLERRHRNLVLLVVERVLVRQHQDLQVLHGIPVIQLERRQERLHLLSTNPEGVIEILIEISKVSS